MADPEVNDKAKQGVDDGLKPKAGDSARLEGDKWAESSLEEEILRVCKHGTVEELVPLLDQLRKENTKLQDYRPDRDKNHFVMSMLLNSLHGNRNGQNREDILRYLVDTFNPTRYDSQDPWLFDRRIAYAAPCLDVDLFKILWQYNHDLTTRQPGHIGQPLVFPIIRNDLKLAEFMMQNGADPLNDLRFGGPISFHDYEFVDNPEMKELLKRYQRIQNRKFEWGDDMVEYWESLYRRVN